MAESTGSTPTAPEVGKKIEPRDNRETVVNAFNSSFSLLEQVPEDQLSQEEIWTKQAIKAAKEKTIDQEKDTFTNSFENLETGETFTQEEGIPLEGLLEFLRKSAEPLAPDSDEKKELIRLAHVLYRNSQSFTRLPHRMEPARLLGRVRQEAYFVSKDVRATGSDFDNWLKAERTLMGRLELVLPQPEVQPAAPPPEEQPEPEAAPAQPTAESPTETAEQPAGEAPVPAAEPTPPVEPQPETLDEVRREHNITITRRDTDIVKRARELTDQLLTKEMRKGSAFNPLNWGRKIGLRVMEDYWRQRLTTQIAEAMRQNNNSYLALDLSKSSIVALDLFRSSTRSVALETQAEKTSEREAGKAKVEQIQIGEKIEGEEIVEVQGELKKMMVSEILRPIVDGQITTEEQVQQKLREFVKAHENDPQIQAVFGRDKTRYGRLADYFAFNLIETGEAIKQDRASHHFALEQLDEVVKIKLANMRWAAETEATFNRVDKVIAWFQRHRVGGLVANPAFVGAAFSLGTFLGLRAPGGAARVAAPFVAPVVGTLAGAAVAAARRNYDLKVDMAMHRRERAYNLQIPQGAPRREALERFTYNTASVKELIDGGGQELLTGTVRKSLQELLKQDLSDGQVTNRANVLRRVAEIKTRLDFSSREKTDLITFEAREQVEQGRLALIKEILAAHQTLRTAGMSDAEISQLETNFTGEWNSRLTQNREQQDRAFAHYRLRNAAGAAVFGGVAGLAGGVVSQEGFTQIARHFPEAANIPVIGGLFQKGETAAERVLRGIGIEVPGVPTGVTVETLKNLYQTGGALDLDKNLRVDVSPADHSIQILDKTANQIFKGKLLPDGKLLDLEGVDTTNRQLVDSLRTKLDSLGFTTNIDPIAKETPSVVDKVKEFFSPQNPDAQKQFKQGVIDFFVDKQGQTKLVDGGVELKGITDSATAELTFDASKNPGVDFDKIEKDLRDAGFTNVNRLKTPAGPIDILEHFRAKGELEKAMRILWHDNNTPMRLVNGVLVGADGKELQLHHHVLKGGTVDLDMSQMISRLTPRGWENWDFTVDNQYNRLVKDIVQNADGSRTYKNFEFLITPNDAADKAREVIRIAAQPNGHADLPPGSELRKFFQLDNNGDLVLDKNGKPIQLARFIEVAHIEKDAAGNITGRTILATSVGKGMDTITPPPIDILKATPSDLKEIVTHYNLDAIPPPELEAPPIIPIPFAPRHPLEPLKKGEVVPPAPLYGTPYGYAGYGVVPTSTEIPLREEARNVLRPAEEVLQSASPAQPIASAPPPPPSTGASIPTTPEVTTTSEGDADAKLAELKLFLADETQTPVAPEDINDAQRGVERFVKSDEVGDAQRAAGMNNLTATQLYKQMLLWLKNNRIADLENDDPNADPQIHGKIQELLQLYAPNKTSDEIKRAANRLTRFTRDNGIFDFRQGNLELNLWALIGLYRETLYLALR